MEREKFNLIHKTVCIVFVAVSGRYEVYIERLFKAALS